MIIVVTALCDECGQEMPAHVCDREVDEQFDEPTEADLRMEAEERA